MFQAQNGIDLGEASLTNHHEKLDVLEALSAHVRWKRQLLNYISGRDEEVLDPGMVRCDTQCSLGHWIQEYGSFNDGQNPVFTELRVLHGDFHHHAAEVVCAVNHGQRRKALELVQRGEFDRVSRRLSSVLARLSLEVE